MELASAVLGSYAVGAVGDTEPLAAGQLEMRFAGHM